MECLLLIRELAQMAEHLRIPCLQHLTQFYDPSAAPLLPQVVVDCHLKNKESSEYRSAYGQLCDWLYGWNVSASHLVLTNAHSTTGGDDTPLPPVPGRNNEDEEGSTLQSITEMFKVKRPLRAFDLSKETENEELERITRVFDTLLSITCRQLRKRELQIEDELPRIGLGLDALKVGGGADAPVDPRRANDLWKATDPEAPDAPPEELGSGKKSRRKKRAGDDANERVEDSDDENDSEDQDAKDAAGDGNASDAQSGESDDGAMGPEHQLAEGQRLQGNRARKGRANRQKQQDDSVVVKKSRRRADAPTVRLSKPVDAQSPAPSSTADAGDAGDAAQLQAKAPRSSAASRAGTPKAVSPRPSEAAPPNPVEPPAPIQHSKSGRRSSAAAPFPVRGRRSSAAAPKSVSRRMSRTSTVQPAPEAPATPVPPTTAPETAAPPAHPAHQALPLTATDTVRQEVVRAVGDTLNLLFSDLVHVITCVDDATDLMLISMSISLLLMGFGELRGDTETYDRLQAQMHEALADYVKTALQGLWVVLQRELSEADPLVSTLLFSLEPPATSAAPPVPVTAASAQEKLEQDPFGIRATAQSTRPVEFADIQDILLLRQRLRYMAILRQRWAEVERSVMLGGNGAGSERGAVLNLHGAVKDSAIAGHRWARLWRKFDLLQVLSRAVDVHVFPPLVVAHHTCRYAAPAQLAGASSALASFATLPSGGSGAHPMLTLALGANSDLQRYIERIRRGGSAVADDILGLFIGLWSSGSFCVDAAPVSNGANSDSGASGKPGKSLFASAASRSAVRALQMSVYDTDLWLSGGDDGQVRIFDLRAQHCVAQFVGHRSLVSGVAFVDRLDARIVTASFDRTLKLWNAQAAFCERTLVGHTDMILTVDACKDTTCIASGGADCTVRIWDGNSGLHLATLSRHSRWVRIVRFVPDGRYLLSASIDGQVCVWDMKVVTHARNPNLASPLRVMDLYDEPILDMVIGPDATFATSARDYTLRVHNYLTGQELIKISLASNYASALAYSPSGEYIAAASLDNTLTIYSVATGDRLRQLRVVNQGITVIRWVRASRWTPLVPGQTTSGSAAPTVAAPAKEPVGADTPGGLVVGKMQLVGVEWLVIGTQEGLIQKVIL